MKKKALIVYSWIIVSVIVQLSAYFFVDKVYLGDRNSIAEMKFTPVSTNGDTLEEVKEEPELSVSLPEGASDVKVSYDGTYCTYMLDKKLYIIDIGTNEIKKVIENYFVDNSNAKNKVEGNITCYEWIPFKGKNAVMYGVSALKDASGRAQIFTYDVDTENEHVGVTFYSEYVPRNGFISDIIISPQTMVHYVKIRLNENQERFIRINLMDEFSPSIILNTGIEAKIGYFSEDLYYKDVNNKIAVKSGFKSAYYMETSFNPALVGVAGASREGKDRIYLGSLNSDNKADKIYYGLQGTDIASWKTLTIDTPVLPENILIKSEEEVYAINHEAGELSNLLKGNKVAFSGKFVDAVNEHIAYLDGNKLKFKPFNKK